MYSMKDKRERNSRLVAYYVAHPDMTIRAIGKVFHISHARVAQIVGMRWCLTCAYRQGDGLCECREVADMIVLNCPDWKAGKV